MSVICIIPARLNSSRFPGKLLKKIGAKTVLQVTFEKAVQCKEIHSVFVATDSDEIEQHVQSFGGDVIRTGSCENGTMRIIQALQIDKRIQTGEFILNLQGDHPSTSPKTLSAIIDVLRGDPEAKMSTGVTKIQKKEEFLSPHVVKCVFDQFGNALYFSRSPIPYHVKDQKLKAHAHLGVYCYRTSFLLELAQQKQTPNQKLEDLEQLGVLEKGDRIKIALVEEEILGIDTPEDLRRYLCKQNISLSQAESSLL